MFEGSIGTPALWTAFVVFVLAFLALDLGVFHRKAHEVSVKEATVWSVVWVALAGLFALGLWATHGRESALEFATGYVIEKALSVDNIFVFVVIFGFFAVPRALQHRVLFWGILGALVLRAVFVVAGAVLLERFHWTIYVFGAVLVLTGIKLFAQRDVTVDPSANPLMKLFRRWLPVSDGYDGERFFTRVSGRRAVTPLFLALVAVEATDVVFAVDSIPAIFAVTDDPFIVFTSNIFALLGLRSLYFLLAGVVGRFRYLKLGLAAVLVFVGAKLGASGVVAVPASVSLAVIAVLLGGSVVASLLAERRTRVARAAPSSSSPRASES